MLYKSCKSWTYHSQSKQRVGCQTKRNQCIFSKSTLQIYGIEFPQVIHAKIKIKNRFCPKENPATITIKSPHTTIRLNRIKWRFCEVIIIKLEKKITAQLCKIRFHKLHDILCFLSLEDVILPVHSIREKIITCTALPPSRQPTGSILKAVVVNPHLQCWT